MKIKKSISLVLAIILMVAIMLPLPAGAATGKIGVVINGKPVSMEPSPVLINGRVLVPVRPVSEAVGATVDWEQETGRIKINRGIRSVTLYVPTATNYETGDWARINGHYTDLDVPARIIKGRTFVPLRFISEALGGEVNWDKDTSTVTINIPEIKELEGLSASVRDAVYQTLLAKSFRYNIDVQLKDPPYPQLNIIKLKGDKDKKGNISAKGHIIGWNLDAFTDGSELYAKNALFNNSWVDMSEFIGEDADDFKRFIYKESIPYLAQSHDYATELIRALGEPNVVAEETVGGTLCQKIVFTPNIYSAKAFLDLRYVYEDLTSASLVLWVGKSDNLVHKFDLRVDYNDYNYKTDQEEPGFAHVIMELWDLNQDFKVQAPDDFKK